MRIAIRSLVLSVALAAAAHGAIVGTGDSIAVAGGNGVDLLVWRDGASVAAMVFGSTGTPAYAAPITLPLPSGGAPDAAWDGSGFVIAWEAAGVSVARIPVSGGSAFAMRIPTVAAPDMVSVASLENGASVLAWGTLTATHTVYTASLSAEGDLGPLNEIDTTPGGLPLIARSGNEYLLSLVVASCHTNLCSWEEVMIQRLNNAGVAIGPRFRWPFDEDLAARWTLVGGDRPLLAIPGWQAPTATTLFSIDPARYAVRERRIRFPEALRAQQTAEGSVLVGLGSSMRLRDDLAIESVAFAPLPDGERLLGVLPSSGARVLAPASGAGAISVEAPAADVSEVGLTPVFVSPGTVWLKVDNRGPDAARTIDVWVTAPVQSFSSLVSGTITRAGALSRLRFHPNLKQGAGFEIAMYFEQPIDAQAFEAWALTLGTDRDATNNYVSTRVEPEPPPEPPKRRRLVGR